MKKIGITERGDAALNTKWIPWVVCKRPAILITKDPSRLFNIINAGESSQDYNIIIHCTITGNGGTDMEPYVPDYKTSLQGYRKFVEKYGKDRVVLRIDPIIHLEPYIDNSLKVLEEAKLMMGDNMTRVRISFMDNYEHVKERMIKNGQIPFDFSFNAPLRTRISIWEKMGKPLLCGEKDMPSVGCISETDCQILNVEPDTKTTGQRKACQCLNNKLELLNTPQQCEHNCVYCYWKKENKKGLF